MPSHDHKPSLRDDRQEAFIADVTCAVYQVVLRDAHPSNWLDLQLALWDVIRCRLEAWRIDERDSVLCLDRDGEHEEIAASIADVARRRCPV